MTNEKIMAEGEYYNQILGELMAKDKKGELKDESIIYLKKPKNLNINPLLILPALEKCYFLHLIEKKDDYIVVKLKMVEYPRDERDLL